MYVSHESDADIARSRSKLGRVAMHKLFRLSMEQPWLEHLQDELGDLWDMCQSAEEQELICDLLHRFCYLESNTFARCVGVIERWIGDAWQLSPSNTVITGINRSKYSDSSEAILWHLKPALAKRGGWSTTNLISGLRNAVGGCVENGSIVLIDEFSGTGGTAAKAIAWIKKELVDSGLVNVQVYFVCIAAMEQAIQRIEQETDKLFSTVILTKGIDDFYDGQELLDARSFMLRLEGELEKVVAGSSMPSFGYKKSQSLYAMESGNTPNNVFPIFWWRWLAGGTARRTLLSRL